MPQVRIAAGAQHFDAAHAQGIVFTVNDGVGFQRCVETGPTATGVEFGASIEQWTVAAFAQVGARTLFIPIHSGKRSLGFPLGGATAYSSGESDFAILRRFSRPFDFCAHIAPFFST
jgi:hypothetical protein